MEEGSEKKKPAEKPPGSPFSPFPFGSSIQLTNRTPFSGSPGQRILLGRTSLGEPTLATSLLNGTDTASVYTPRLKAQELYGGPVMFGTSANRKNRLLSSTPYSAALRLREKDRLKSRSLSGALPAPATSLASPFSTLPGAGMRPDSAPPTDSMSSTARLILDTLDKMSTPLMDARKIPVLARAEKRKALEEELNCSLSGPSRRRPRLGCGPPEAGSPAAFNGTLSGPPLRKTYAPVPAATGRPQPPPPSLVLRSGGTTSVSLYAGTDFARPPSPASPFRPAFSDVSTPLPSATAGGKIKSKVSELGKQRAERLNQQEAVTATPLSAYLNQPKLDISSSQLPVIRLSPPSATPALPPSSTAAQQQQQPPRVRVPASAGVSTTVSASPLPASLAGMREAARVSSLPTSEAAAPSISSGPATPLSSAVPASRSGQSTAGVEAKSSSSSDSSTLIKQTPSSWGEKGGPVAATAIAAAAVGQSRSNGSPPPQFRFTELKALSTVRLVNCSVQRQFVFSKPDLPARRRVMSPHKTTTTTPANFLPAAVATATRPPFSSSFSSFMAASPAESSQLSTGGGGGKIKNGHNQSSSSFNSLGSSSSFSSSSPVFSSGTNGFAGGTVSPPFVNFKSAAMPDVTNSAKLSKGVDRIQGVLKNSSNSLLPDLTASTTFDFAAVRPLKAGSVMDILGKKA